jgi:heme exporter protein CcmD
MIDLSADHLGFVAMSYGIAAIIFAGLVGKAVLSARRLKRELDARGLSDPGERDKAT